jgi:hypothetical protein
MKTTKKQALKLFEIANWCDKYSINSFDKKEYIESYMSLPFEENLKYLKEFIYEGYETIEEIKKDNTLIELLKDINALDYILN